MTRHEGSRSLWAAGASIAIAQAAERDVLGWESARWGMSESEIKEAFSSKLMVPLMGEQAGETVLSIPGYVFLGCPFDVSFRFAALVGWFGSIYSNHSHPPGGRRIIIDRM